MTSINRAWASLRFGAVRVETRVDDHLFEVELFHHNLNPSAVRVELYANGVNGAAPFHEEMALARPLPDASSGCVYQVTIPTTRPAADYTVRVIPRRDGVAIPLECGRILWQR